MRKRRRILTDTPKKLIGYSDSRISGILGKRRSYGMFAKAVYCMASRIAAGNDEFSPRDILSDVRGDGDGDWLHASIDIDNPGGDWTCKADALPCMSVKALADVLLTLDVESETPVGDIETYKPIIDATRTERNGGKVTQTVSGSFAVSSIAEGGDEKIRIPLVQFLQTCERFADGDEVDDKLVVGTLLAYYASFDHAFQTIFFPDYLAKSASIALSSYTDLSTTLAKWNGYNGQSFITLDGVWEWLSKAQDFSPLYEFLRETPGARDVLKDTGIAPALDTDETRFVFIDSLDSDIAPERIEAFIAADSMLPRPYIGESNVEYSIDVMLVVLDSLNGRIPTPATNFAVILTIMRCIADSGNVGDDAQPKDGDAAEAISTVSDVMRSFMTFSSRAARAIEDGIPGEASIVVSKSPALQEAMLSMDAADDAWADEDIDPDDEGYQPFRVHSVDMLCACLEHDNELANAYADDGWDMPVETLRDDLLKKTFGSTGYQASELYTFGTFGEANAPLAVAMSALLKARSAKIDGKEDGSSIDIGTRDVAAALMIHETAVSAIYDDLTGDAAPEDCKAFSCLPSETLGASLGEEALLAPMLDMSDIPNAVPQKVRGNMSPVDAFMAPIRKCVQFEDGESLDLSEMPYTGNIVSAVFGGDDEPDGDTSTIVVSVAINEVINALEKQVVDGTDAMIFDTKTRVYRAQPFIARLTSYLALEIENHDSNGKQYGEMVEKHGRRGVYAFAELMALSIVHAIFSYTDNGSFEGINQTTGIIQDMLYCGVSWISPVEAGKSEDAKKGGKKGQNANWSPLPDSRIRLTSRLCTDMTAIADEQVSNGTAPAFIGRGDSIDEVITVLSRKDKGNPILLGDGGVGKTAIVEELCRRIVKGDVPSQLKDARIMSLTMGGIAESGMPIPLVFENVAEEIHGTNVIIFMDEFHQIDNVQGAKDAMKPFLARDGVHFIGSTTEAEFNNSLRKDKAFMRRLTPVHVREMSFADTLEILKARMPEYEAAHDVKYDDGLCEVIANAASDYIAGQHSPDRELDVLDMTGAIAHNGGSETAGEQDVFKAVRILTANPSIKSTSEMLAVAKSIGGDGAKKTVDDAFPSVAGQRRAKEQIVDALSASRLGLSPKDRPRCVLMFAGPSGVGKTETARQMLNFLSLPKTDILVIDLSTYTTKWTASRLLGSEPGYVGYSEGGLLTNFCMEHPSGIVVLDEIDKCCQEISNLFLGILDTGFLDSSSKEHIDCRGMTFIITTNQGFMTGKEYNGVGFNTKSAEDMSKEFEKDVLDGLNQRFGAPFMGRIDKTVVFERLTGDDIREACRIHKDEMRNEYLMRLGLDVDVILDGKFDEIVDGVLDSVDTNAVGVRGVWNQVSKEIRKRIVEAIETE